MKSETNPSFIHPIGILYIQNKAKQNETPQGSIQDPPSLISNLFPIYLPHRNFLFQPHTFPRSTSTSCLLVSIDTRSLYGHPHTANPLPLIHTYSSSSPGPFLPKNLLRSFKSHTTFFLITYNVHPGSLS